MTSTTPALQVDVEAALVLLGGVLQGQLAARLLDGRLDLWPWPNAYRAVGVERAAPCRFPPGSTARRALTNLRGWVVSALDQGKAVVEQDAASAGEDADEAGDADGKAAHLHKSYAGDWNALGERAAVTLFLEHAAKFLGNGGNYKSFGDSKFIPRCAEADVAASAATSPDAERHYRAVNGAMFSADHPSAEGVRNIFSTEMGQNPLHHLAGIPSHPAPESVVDSELSSAMSDPETWYDDEGAAMKVLG